MSIKIKKNKAPMMKPCPMLCDEDLDPKLNEYDLTKFLNCHQASIIIGKPASGKTSAIYSFFKNKKLLKSVYDKIFLFQPETSRASMQDPIFDALPEEQKFNELTLETLQDMESQLEGNSCLIFDDMTAYLKDKEIQKKLKELIYNRRHLHLSIFFLVQTWLSVPKDIRKIFTNLFVFRVNKAEFKTIADEMIEGHSNKIDDILRIVYDKPHQFLFINVDSQRCFKNYDELLF